jgi:hypothetical protein
MTKSAIINEYILVILIRSSSYGAYLLNRNYVAQRQGLMFLIGQHGYRRGKGILPLCKGQGLSLDTLLALSLESLSVPYSYVYTLT